MRVWKEVMVPEKETFLRLIERDDKTFLVVVDESGEIVSGGYLMQIREDGTFYRHYSGHAPGIQTDENGRMKERNETKGKVMKQYPES